MGTTVFGRVNRRGDLTLLAALAVSSAASVGLETLRSMHARQLGLVPPVYKGYWFLVWNLFLAWVPLGLAGLIQELHRLRPGRRIAMILLGFLWLLFLPNAAYMVTDLLHLVIPPVGAPIWYDALLVFSFAWNGLLVGLVSMDVMHRVVQARAGRIAGWAMIVMAILLSGFGIYVGRFERWNSWDMLRSPWAVTRDVLGPLVNPDAYRRAGAVTVLLSGFLFLAYLTLRAMMHHRQTEDPDA